MSRMAMGSAAWAFESRTRAKPIQSTCNCRTRGARPGIGGTFYHLSAPFTRMFLFRHAKTAAIIRVAFSGGTDMTVNQSLETYVEQSRTQFEKLLGQMVEIPSISMDPD